MLFKIQDGNKFGGFYFDQQMKNPLTSVTLHKNMDEGGPAPRLWKPSSRDDPDASGRYDKEPIARAIIADDFEVVIGNNFQGFGGDPIGQAISGISGSLSPYFRYGEQMISAIEAQTSVYTNDNPDSTVSKIKNIAEKGWEKVTGTLNSIVGEDVIEDFKEHFRAGHQFILQGTRFKYYAGTDVTYGNIAMKFYYFSGYDQTGRQFKTVYDQLKPLMPYIVGKMQDVTSEKSPIGTFIGQFAKWQSPPGGFMSDMKDIDAAQDGTLRMIVGCYYCIESLVVQNANLRFSKQMVKHPEKYGEVCPMFCEVSLLLTPATRYSNDSLTRFVSGVGTQVRRKDEVVSAIQGTITPG